MIIWINGPFGVGKTTTASLVAAGIPGAVVFNPEVLGGVLNHVLLRRGDFQDLRIWRSVTSRTVSRRGRGHTLVVPMTVLDRSHLSQFLDGLPGALHVTLNASTPELERRIAADTVETDALPWRTSQVARYERAAADLAARGPVVETDGLNPTEVAASVIALARPRLADWGN